MRTKTCVRNWLMVIITIAAALLITACSGGSENVPVSGDIQAVSVDAQAAGSQEAQAAADATNTTNTTNAANAANAANTADVAENKPPELYPAYIMEGSQKKWGYINEDGEFIISPKYENADDFRSNGTAMVFAGGRWGLIDKTGRELVAPRYMFSSGFSDKAYVASDGKGTNYLLDEQGRILFCTEGSIDVLSCGLAAFSKRTDEDKYLWGYIDEEGRVVIEPAYTRAQAFVDGRAVVETTSGRFGIIDKEGVTLKEISSFNLFGLSEDTVIFSGNPGGSGMKLGYMTLDGKILLDAVYNEAQKFEDGLAIVNAAKEYGNEYGVINKEGEFIIPPKYSAITSLENGFYAVPEAHDDYYPSSYIKKALFDKTGKQLTDFRFYDLERLESGMISATDDKYTYLVDESGKEITSIPRAEGIGSIRQCGKLYKVQADDRLYYLSSDGKKVWEADNTVRLGGGLEVKRNTFRPDRCMLIYYPELAGLADPKVQDKINTLLRDEFVGDNSASAKEGNIYTESVDISFTAAKNKDLLIISKSMYFYPIGAAHGQPAREEYHIDLKTGKLYSLKDLFKDGSKYTDKLTNIVKDMIVRTNNELGDKVYYEDIGNLSEDTGFSIKKDSVVIYFHPYELAAYAAGFPEFSISFGMLGKLIDTEGEFWKSFDRELTDGTGFIEDLSPDDRSAVEEAVKGYENTLIEAINNNDFKLAEPWLYPDSSLYLSQKKLVADLNKKQIKERLEKYTVEAAKSNSLGVIRAYVSEEIAIRYPGEDYTIKQFHWEYSLRYSYELKHYQLTYIDKWEKK